MVDPKDTSNSTVADNSIYGESIIINLSDIDHAIPRNRKQRRKEYSIHRNKDKKRGK